MCVQSVQWIFGYSKDVIGGVQSLTKSGRNALFTISAHSGIIYDFEFRTQTVLQGHCNFISCCAISKDKRWIVTADAGTDSLLVVWDSHSGAPVKTLFNPHPSGICSVDISDDALFVTTLSQPDEVRVKKDYLIAAFDNCCLFVLFCILAHSYLMPL